MKDKDNVVAIDARRRGREQTQKQWQRTAWAVLNEEEAKRPGAELLAMLYRKANEDGLQLNELAAALGVTYGYLHQLKSGLRLVSQVSDEFIVACARYLGQPKLYVMGLAGKIRLQDFVAPASLEGELDAAIQLMYSDPAWGGYMPLTYRSMDIRERLLIVRLYEAATGRRLLTWYEPTKDITR